MWAKQTNEKVEHSWPVFISEWKWEKRVLYVVEYMVFLRETSPLYFYITDNHFHICKLISFFIV